MKPEKQPVRCSLYRLLRKEQKQKKQKDKSRCAWGDGRQESLLRNGFSLAVNYVILNLIMPEYRRKEFYAVTRDIPGADETAPWQ
jgi:hypothetical protein